MYKIQIETPQNVEIQNPTASLVERILAHLIDLILIIVFIIIIYLVFEQVQYSTNYALSYNLILFFESLPLFYPLAFEYFNQGQTIGKKIMKIKVIHMDGSRPSLGSYTIRWFIGLLECYLLIGAPAVLSVMFSKKGQRIGDLAGNTTIIKLEDRSFYQSETQQFSSDYEMQFPIVKILNDSQISVIHRVLRQKKMYVRNKQIVALSQKIRETLNINTELKPKEFLIQVIKDYEFLYWLEENKGQIEELKYQDRMQKQYGSSVAEMG